MAGSETTRGKRNRNGRPARRRRPTVLPGPLLEPEFLHKLEQLELVSKRIFVGRMKGERKSKRRG